MVTYSNHIMALRCRVGSRPQHHKRTFEHEPRWFASTLALYKEHHTITEYATELKKIDPARWERGLPEIQAIARKEKETKKADAPPEMSEATRRQIWTVKVGTRSS